jgi:hypothetical protein
VNRLKNILQSKQITLFALIDHSGEAAKVGMKMPPTKLLIFGSPKAGTPLMLASQHRPRPPSQDPGFRRCSGKGLALVQQLGVPKRAAWSPVESAAKHCGHRNISGHGRTVVRRLRQCVAFLDRRLAPSWPASESQLCCPSFGYQSPRTSQRLRSALLPRRYI